MGWLRPLPGLLIVLLACGDGGRVELRLELPEPGPLYPVDGRVDLVAIDVRAGGELVYTAQRPMPEPGAGIDLGRVPLVDGAVFEVELQSEAGRVIGYGRSAAPVDVDSDQVVPVALPLRRPFVYLAGAEAVVAVDGSLEVGQNYQSAIDVGVTDAVATSADGRELLVASSDKAVLVATDRHTDAGYPPVALGGPALRLAISPDGAHAVATHEGMTNGVTVIDLESMRRGEPRSTFYGTDRASSVAVSDDYAFVLIDRVAGFSCAGTSQVAVIPLADPEARTAVELPGLASELSYDPGADSVLVAMACGGGVVAVGDPAGDPEVSTLVDLEGASAIAVSDGKVVAVGHVDGEFAHLLVATAPSGSTDFDLLDLPTLEERAESLDLTRTGQSGQIEMTADLASASDVVVMPDDQHVAILVAAGYIAEQAGDAGGQPIIPELVMVTYEYQLIDLAAALPVQRMRLSCQLSWNPGAVLDDFVCAQAAGQDLSDLTFVPRSLTALFGHR